MGRSMKAIEELPLLMTVEEVAALLRIGRNGVYAAVADGSFPAIRIGRAIRVPRDALLETIAHRDRRPALDEGL